MAEIINGTLRMLSDRILIKPLDWDASKTIIAIRHGRPVRGEVIAVGPGHHPIKYRRNEKGPKGLMDYSKHFRPTEVKPGDIVELGGLNQFDGKGYQFTEVIYNGELHLICQERDVAIVRDDLRAEKPDQSRYIAPSVWAANVDWAYERRMAEALDGRA